MTGMPPHIKKLVYREKTMPYEQGRYEVVGPRVKYQIEVYDPTSFSGHLMGAQLVFFEGREAWSPSKLRSQVVDPRGIDAIAEEIADSMDVTARASSEGKCFYIKTSSPFPKEIMDKFFAKPIGHYCNF